MTKSKAVILSNVTHLLLWIPLQICKPVQGMHTKVLHSHQNPAIHAYILRIQIVGRLLSKVTMYIILYMYMHTTYLATGGSLMCSLMLAEWSQSRQKSPEVSEGDRASSLLLHAAQIKEIGDLKRSHLSIALGLL